MTTKKEYRITTIESMAQIPEDKLGAFIIDFYHYLLFCRNDSHLKIVSSLDLPDGMTKPRNDGFVWRDDGIEGIPAVDFHDPDGRKLGRIPLGTEDGRDGA